MNWRNFFFFFFFLLKMTVGKNIKENEDWNEKIGRKKRRKGS